MTARSLLVLGGVRAGKSAFAVARAATAPGRVTFVATAQALDEEMAARIARHQATRPTRWGTVEAPIDLVEALRALEGRSDVILVDCLNLWVANLVQTEQNPGDLILDEAGRLAALLARRPFDAILVSNEVGLGVHPETALGRRFRDALGLVNQTVARAVDEVVLVVAGCPLWVKGRDGG